MEQNLSLHNTLKYNRNKANCCLSSILMTNKDVPLFEECYGQLDYDWLLRVTEDRVCRQTEPVVNRYVDGKNLSLNPEYRKRDFYMNLLLMDDDLRIVKKLYASRARYYYVMGIMDRARFHFIRGVINWKTILYIIISYNKALSKFVIKKFNVFG